MTDGGSARAHGAGAGHRRRVRCSRCSSPSCWARTSSLISSSDEKIARVKALGADAAINYTTTPEWYKAAREITGGRGFDHIVELGGDEDAAAVAALHPARRDAVDDRRAVGRRRSTAPLGLVVTRQVRLQGITVGNRDGFEAMLRAIAQHKMKPVVDRVSAFEQLKEAMAYLKSGAHFGKVCIQH